VLDAWSRRAEERIRVAIERGELDGLPGAGRPLDLDDDALVPQALRVAYRVLRNAGVVPEQVRVRGEMAALERLLESAPDEASRVRGLRRLEALRMRVAAASGGERALRLHDQANGHYRGRLAEKLSGSDED